MTDDRRRELLHLFVGLLLGFGLGGGCRDGRERERDRRDAELRALVIEVHGRFPDGPGKKK